MTRPIPLLAVLLAFATPTFAAEPPPNSASLATQQAARSITVQNSSGSRITQAHVQTTDGRTWNIGHGGVGTNESAQVVVPARDCIANVSAELSGGRKLQAVGLHSCHNSQIVVRENRIEIPQIAVPGAKQHGTPG
jgi:hypothetical protein